jgi:hypothetical protein
LLPHVFAHGGTIHLTERGRECGASPHPANTVILAITTVTTNITTVTTITTVTVITTIITNTAITPVTTSTHHHHHHHHRNLDESALPVRIPLPRHVLECLKEGGDSCLRLMHEVPMLIHCC